MSGIVTYDPGRFVQATVPEAKAVILTPEVGLTTDERWEQETEWLIPHLSFDDAGLVIDYGCGIGRLSRHPNAPVLGVDISPTMRGMATIEQAGTAFFSAVTPQMLKQMAHCGLRAHGAFVVWVLQHAMNPEVDIDLLAEVLVPGSHLVVVNRDSQRCVPVRTEDDREGWAEDEIDIFALLAKAFEQVERIPMPEFCIPGASLRRFVRR